MSMMGERYLFPVLFMTDVTSFPQESRGPYQKQEQEDHVVGNHREARLNGADYVTDKTEYEAPDETALYVAQSAEDYHYYGDQGVLHAHDR